MILNISLPVPPGTEWSLATYYGLSPLITKEEDIILIAEDRLENDREELIRHIRRCLDEIEKSDEPIDFLLTTNSDHRLQYLSTTSPPPEEEKPSEE